MKVQVVTQSPEIINQSTVVQCFSIQRNLKIARSHKMSCVDPLVEYFLFSTLECTITSQPSVCV